MLNAVISWSITHRRSVIVAALCLALAGVAAFVRLPLDAFPDTTPVQVQVNTVAPALSPLEIERQITAPIERSVAGIPRLAEQRSISKFGFSQVTLVFEDGMDVYFARQLVSERLQTVALPAGIERPQPGPVATGLGEVLHYLVRGDGKSLAELRSAQEWIIEPQLRALPGVAEVNTWGGDERQIHVLVDPARLAEHDVTLSELVEALERNNGSAGGGSLDAGGQATLVRGIGLITEPLDVGNIAIGATNGVPTRVRDVARVAEGRALRTGAVTAEGRGEAVLGLGFMLMGENSHDVTRRLRLRLDEIVKTLPEGVEVVPVYDRTELVDHVLHTVRTNLFEGALLVIAVLFALLGNFRAGLIVASAIPLSMLFAFDLMVRAGIAGTLMSLGAIDFGLIVDSSVIQVENALRRLGEDRSDRRTPDVVREAAIEVRQPTMFGELVIMIVYLPILALEGVEGKLFRPMALTVIFALVGSMILSLTLVPALCATFLPRRPRHHESTLLAPLQRGYGRLLGILLRRPKVVVAAAGAVLAGGALLATRLGTEFIPRLQEGALVINTVRLAGVSVDESVRYGTRIERALLEEFPDEVEHVWTRTGTAEVATDPMGLEVSDVFLTLTPRERWKRAKTQPELALAMQEELSSFPGTRMIFTQPIEMRVNEMTAGVRADIAVKLFGDDFATLEAKAREIERRMREIPGSADVSIEQLTGQPVLEVRVDRDAIARHGMAAGDVLDVVATLGPREVGMLQEGERLVPIAVSLEDRYRADATALGTVLVSAPNGDRVPLERLARLEPTEGPSTITREGGKRRIVVQTNVRDRSMTAYVGDLERVLRDVSLPPGYYVQLGGQFEHFERARARLAIVVPIALALILALLYLTYRRWADALRVFTGVPFAAVGGVLALVLRDLPFSISAAVGFIALSGVSVFGDMVLVSTIRQLLERGTPMLDAVRSAAERRLRPVLVTALVASLGFVPMALNTGIGAEVQRPLATVVIGGVVTSTALTLIVLPAFYLVVGRFRHHENGGS